MIISRTPLRISFFGGGTDYPQWYNQYGGAVLGASINKYCYVMLHNGKSWSTFDLPNKSGLGSSSAYTVGLLRVCAQYDNIIISRLATTWEQDKTNGQVGSQDQYLCAVGGCHLLKFSEHGIRDELVASHLMKPLESWLMLFDTYQYRMNGGIIPQQLREMEIHQELYGRLGEMPTEGLNLVKTENWVKFGVLLNEAWEIKRQLSNIISTPVIDKIYSDAMIAGAAGGKLLGGGGGGFILFVVEPGKQEEVKKALSELTCVPFEFEYEGSKVIYKDD